MIVKLTGDSLVSEKPGRQEPNGRLFAELFADGFELVLEDGGEGEELQLSLLNPNPASSPPWPGPWPSFSPV